MNKLYAVYAAEKLARQWIGIDISNLAIDMTCQWIHAVFPYSEYSLFEECHATFNQRKTF